MSEFLSELSANAFKKMRINDSDSESLLSSKLKSNGKLVAMSHLRFIFNPSFLQKDLLNQNCIEEYFFTFDLY